MKTLGAILALMATFVGTPAEAATATGCVPYTIPIATTVTTCGSGLIGSKYKTLTKACPSGVVTQSTDYDTTGCLAPPAAVGGVNLTNQCAVTPDACAPSPTAATCPASYHWTLIGSNLAHCVHDDYACSWGNSLVHDGMGNPNCVANTCPSNQVLQGDGISCGCPSSLPVWSGSVCTNPPITCVVDSQAQAPVACGVGYSGTQYQIMYTSCPSGQYGAPSYSYSAFNTSSCVALAVTCSAGTQTTSTTCGAGYVGTQYRTETTSCPGGSYGAPSMSYSGYNTSSCGCANGATNYPTCTLPVTCVASSSTSSASCGTNYTGTQFTTSTTSCPAGSYGAPSYSSSVNTSSCGCANGATDYPTCTPIAPPPAPTPTCPQDYNSGTGGSMICYHYVIRSGVCTKIGSHAACS